MSEQQNSPEQQPTPDQVRTQVARHALTMSTIQEIDRGTVALQFNQLLRIAAQDIIERPGDKSVRKVQFCVELRPEMDKTTGALDTIANEFTFEVKVPKFRSPAYPMLVNRDGVMHFQPGSPFDPRQMTFKYQPADAPDAKPAPEAPADED